MLAKSMYAMVAAGLILVTICPQALGGVIITGKTSQIGTNRMQVQTVMIEGHRERIESQSQITVIDADQGRIIVLSSATRTYNESTLKPLAQIKDTTQRIDPSFQPTGVERSIAGYQCQVFQASSSTAAGEQNITGCFSSSAPGWKEYRDFNALLARRNGDAADPVKLPPGLPLSIVTKLKVRYPLSPKIAMAHRLEMERNLASRPPVVSEEIVTAIKTAPLNPSLFEIPAGYTKLRIAGPLEH